jgi:hypothetical protein
LCPRRFEAPVFGGPLAAFGTVQLVAVENRAHSAVCRAMTIRYHPLDDGPPCGSQQRSFTPPETPPTVGKAMRLVAKELSLIDLNN